MKGDCASILSAIINHNDFTRSMLEIWFFWKLC